MVRGNRAFSGLSNNAKHRFLQTHETVPLIVSNDDIQEWNSPNIFTLCIRHGVLQEK